MYTGSNVRFILTVLSNDEPFLTTTTVAPIIRPDDFDIKEYNFVITSADFRYQFQNTISHDKVIECGGYRIYYYQNGQLNDFVNKTRNKIINKFGL